MRKTLIITILLICFTTASAQIRVNPTGVNVNSQNQTTAFLTFGQIPAGYFSTEAIWCGELILAPPPVGSAPRC